jgi:23S rRNA (pseudouridine1915-N3)-methyltransferase
MYAILSLSDSDKHFDSALAEYTKRLQKNLTIIDLKPSKADHREMAIQKDTDIIIDWLAKNNNKYDQFILLSINGKDKPTEDRVRSFPVWKKYCFIIGGPHGLDENKLAISNYQLAMIGLGKQTMVHWLAKLVLAEQIYRIWMIQNNRSYHY